MKFRMRYSLVMLLLVGSVSSQVSVLTSAQAGETSSQVSAAGAPASLLAYLRCENAPLDQFGAALIPGRDLIELVRRVNPKADDFNDTPILLEVWPGAQAEVRAIGGYGYFGLLQYYPLEMKDALLKVLAAAGWEMKRKPAPVDLVQNRVDALFSTYEATKSFGALIRRMSLMEARVHPLSEKVDLNGLTLSCSYGKGTAAP
jgi:hypothetical protein